MFLFELSNPSKIFLTFSIFIVILEMLELSKRDKKYSVFDYNIELILIAIVVGLLELLKNKNMAKSAWYISAGFAGFIIYLYIHKVFVTKESFADGDVTTSPVTSTPTPTTYTTTSPPVVETSFLGSIFKWFSNLFSRKTSFPTTSVPTTMGPTTSAPTTSAPTIVDDVPYFPPTSVPTAFGAITSVPTFIQGRI
jgi:hypothetical protein